MKHAFLTMATIAFIGLPLVAQAEDSFGSRFYGEAPVGLGGGTPEDVLSEILAIEPAAGDDAETDAIETIKDGGVISVEDTQDTISLDAAIDSLESE